jgi:hypothetical protein
MRYRSPWLCLVTALCLATACSEQPLAPDATPDKDPPAAQFSAEAGSFNTQSISAGGPVYPAHPGQGATGTGNQGRSGGRTWTYTGIEPGRYSVLAWGPSVAIQSAMDGLVDAAGETMTFSSGLSNLAGGVAVWTGATTVNTVSHGPTGVETRFTLRVTEGGVPVPLTHISDADLSDLGLAAGVAAVRRIATTSFAANLLFEGRTPILFGNNWTPFLDLYDAARTSFGAPSGQAITSFGGGFYYICGPGYYNTNSTCAPAPPGSYVAAAGAAAATLCPPGQYQPNPGQAGCLNTDPGHFADEPGTIQQFACPAGKYAPLPGMMSCLQAEAGHYVDKSGWFEQTPCSAGSYQPGTGQQSCIQASAGHYVASTGQAQQIACVAGQYQPDDGAASCIPTPAGSYAAGTGNTEATLCAPGYYQPATGASSCLAAPLGYYVPEPGADTALPCPAGMTTLATGSVACVAANAAPTITSITGPDPRAVGTLAQIQVHFTDPDAGDSHTAFIDWGDGAQSTVHGVTSGFSASKAYSSVGLYRVTVRVSDAGGEYDKKAYEHIVVYDPSAGFVTGGGWIRYDANACAGSCSGAGRGDFDFVSKYQKGRTVPTGTNRFRFHAGSLVFESTSYAWLIVSGSRAQTKGTGTLNGAAGYSFLITAVDGQVSGGGGVDRFRIKIVHDASGTVVFDNQRAAGDDAPLNTALDKVNGNGSIVIRPK